MRTTRLTHRLYGTARPAVAEARTWIGSRVIDAHGAGVGRLEDIWVDAETGDPAWLLVRGSRFSGGAQRLAPFTGATGGDGRVWLPHERETIRSSPEIGRDGLLSSDLGERLRYHYGLNRPHRLRPSGVRR